MSQQRSKRKSKEKNKSRSRSRSPKKTKYQDWEEQQPKFNHRKRQESNKHQNYEGWQTQKQQKVQNKTNVISQKESQPPKNRRGRINGNILSNIIMQNKRSNKKLDKEEVGRAAIKYKQLFSEQVKPVTMSQFLNNEELQQKLNSFVKQHGNKTLQCDIGTCKEKFEDAQQFHKHILQHKKKLIG